MKAVRMPWGLTIPILLLVLWQLLVAMKVLDPLLFPPPTTLAATASGMVASGELPARLGDTFRLAAAGFGIGATCGLIVGLLMGAYKPFRLLLEPMVSGLNSTPKLTLLPLLMVLVGIGGPARLVLIALGAFVVMAIQGLDAVRSIHPAHLEVSRMHGATPMDLFRRVYLPASLPMIFTGSRVAMGRALVITLSAELVGGVDGLGGVIWLAWQTFAIDRLYVSVMVSALLGVALHAGARRIERKLIPWKSK